MSSPHAVRRWFQRLPDVLPTARPDARAGIIEQHICRALAEFLGVPPGHRFSADRPLCHQGVDPVTALLLKRRLEQALGVTPHRVELLPGDSARTLAERLAPGFGTDTETRHERNGERHARSDIVVGGTRDAGPRPVR
ncbi:acyl carrier protein [Streptomyces sp. S6]